MRRFLRPGPCALAWIAVIATAAASHLVTADEGREPIAIDYRASGSCPDEAAFLTLVHRRTELFRPASPGANVRTFVVALSDVGGPSASIEVIEAGSRRHEGARVVRGHTCQEVADAAALVVALAIDPRALDRVATTVIDAGVLDASEDANVAYASDAAPTPAAPVSLPEERDAAPPSSPTTPAEPARAPPSLGCYAGADFTLATGVSPVTMLGVSPYLGWRALRVSFARIGSGLVTASAEGTAQFTWTVGRADACPLALSLGPVTGSACVRVEAGELEAQGVTVAAPRTQHSFWLAAGPLARVEWAMLGSLFLDAEAELSLHATANRFYFVQDVTVERVPVVGFVSSVGLGAHFL